MKLVYKLGGACKRGLAVMGALVLLVFGSHVAMAQQTNNPPSDMILLKVSEEIRIATESPLVVVQITASFNNTDATAIRSKVLAAMRNLNSTANWDLTEFERGEEASGLESWVVIAEARIPEAQLSKISAGAKKHSKPGFKIDLAYVDWSATHDEREQASAKLRKAIYARAKSELDAANEAFPNRNYRIGLINLGVENASKVAGLAGRGGQMDEIVVSAQKSSGMVIIETLSLEAVIALEALVPEQPHAAE